MSDFVMTSYIYRFKMYHSVISTLTKLTFYWIKFDCKIFATERKSFQVHRWRTGQQKNESDCIKICMSASNALGMVFHRTVFRFKGSHDGHFLVYFPKFSAFIKKLEDLTVLKRSPDLLNNVKIGQDQIRLKMKQILFYVGFGRFCQVT